ncbi:hypothetical protein FHS61_001298 [Altererythrobacter atlanticus]|uniref:Uncharacterized protein n=1 Tax=Croceibacterium atlanticum TaxID=1267766 RepID=A0A0F7KUG2_9SPHN|nr:DUF1737 domain-containing protein [Croceibacterium atlanticum]AKH43983.1 hypothetical protein WYH_02957 [Croceibacterium atlanticum]MBB5732289.1 hypothetical protein [Croceibacterium atlanticum]
MSSTPPDGKLPYRCLTGLDDDKFCARVSDALRQGWRLHGSPSITSDGTNRYVAQAVIWPGYGD